MTVYIEKPAFNLREELASLRNQGGYQEQQFYFDSLVTNGTFDSDTGWTLGAGWSITGGQAVLTSSAGSGDRLEIAGGFDGGSLGTAYAISFDVTGLSGTGTIAFSRMSGTTAFTTNGSKTVYAAVTTVGVGGFTFSTTVGGGMTIDNVSVFEVDANDDVIHTMPKGWKPKDVFEDGLLQREGAAHDYEVVYDGFDYSIKPTVAPSATTQTCVIGVKA